MLVTWVLASSIILQFAAAVWALCLIRITGLKWSWVCIASALGFMGIRRTITFYKYITGLTEHTPDLTAESVAFLISVLMLAGIIGVGAVFQAHEKTKQQAKERQRLLQLLVENSPAAIAMFDRHMCYLAHSKRWLSDYGLNDRDLIGRSHYEIFPETSEHWKEIHRRCLSGEEERCEEDTFSRADGTKEWLRWEILPWRTASEEIGGIVMFTEVITSRVEAVQSLHEKERMLSTLMNNLPGMVYRCRNDRDWTMEFVSEGCSELTGYATADFIGDQKVSFNDLIHPEDRDDIWEQVQAALKLKVPYVLLYRIRTREDLEKWVWERGQGVFTEDGELEALEGFVTDITERKSLEAQLQQSQKMEAIGTLAGGVAHDFNNLMTVVIGYGGILRNRLDEQDPNRGPLESMIKAGERATALTRQLLAFSRKQTLMPKVMNINEIIFELDKMIHRLVPENVEICVELAKNLGNTKVDTTKIEQVVLNLVVNACDAMKGGGVLTIETANACIDESLGLRKELSPGDYVTLSVSDTGHGMDAETQTKIFEPFYTTKEVGRGTGLGLSTVYGIVKQSGGDISVYSEMGKGTKFKIYLPRVDEKKQPSTQSGMAEIVANGNETILVAEDEKGVRELIVLALKSHGYQVLEASNGEEAVRIGRSAKRHVHLLLTDIVMPKFGGKELAEKLISMFPHIKILYLSGYASNALSNQGVLEEGAAFLEKPFAPQRLAQKVREILDAD